DRYFADRHRVDAVGVAHDEAAVGVDARRVAAEYDPVVVDDIDVLPHQAVDRGIALRQALEALRADPRHVFVPGPGNAHHDLFGAHAGGGAVFPPDFRPVGNLPVERAAEGARVIEVDADADDDHVVVVDLAGRTSPGGLDQNAGQLGKAPLNVVGPFHGEQRPVGRRHHAAQHLAGDHSGVRRQAGQSGRGQKDVERAREHEIGTGTVLPAAPGTAPAAFLKVCAQQPGAGQYTRFGAGPL